MHSPVRRLTDLERLGRLLFLFRSTSTISTEESLDSIRERIGLDGSHEATSTRVLRRPLQGNALASWYFLPPTEVPGLQNEEAEYLRQRRLNARQKEDVKEVVVEGKKGKGGK